MKLESIYCDLHPAYTLTLATVESASPVGDRNRLDTWRCIRPTCIRNYTVDFGYFDVEIGKHPDLGDMAGKHRCGVSHPIAYLALTKIDGVLQWACPVGGCKTVKPHEKAVTG